MRAPGVHDVSLVSLRVAHVLGTLTAPLVRLWLLEVPNQWPLDVYNILFWIMSYHEMVRELVIS